MRTVCVVLLIAVGLLPFAFGQTTPASVLQTQLKKVFPTATEFSPKQSSPVPHFIAYTGTGEARTIANKTSGRLPRGTGSIVDRFFTLLGSPNDTDVGPV